MQQLNGEQLEAARHPEGPALVLAGAGSGKTRVIIERLAWLVEVKGVDPRNILAVTFTNRAANEMKERAAKRLGVSTLQAWVGTFHSFGLFVLRREIERLGRKRSFTIFDDADQMSLIKRLIKDLPKGAELVMPREALSWISRLKQKLTTPASQTEPVSDSLKQLWHRYHEALERASAVDFDDLLVLPVQLFQRHPDVCRHFAQRYRYVHIDEYQDTNHAQYEFARLLAQDHGNIFAVGDEDQSIYSWRGADINNILEFEQDFENARVYRLEQNYRSTEAILRVANAVVSNNVMRLGKNLWTAAKGGDKVRLFVADDGAGEAALVVDEIRSRSLPFEATGVLFRTNGQSRFFEEALRRAAIPYRVIGATEFYGRKEVKDLLAYLRLLVNPADDVSLRRVVNVPVRGIGATTFERIEEYAAQRRVPIIQILRDIEHDQSIPLRARAAIADFVRLIDELAIAARNDPIDILARKLVDRIKYREFVQHSDEKDMRSRLEIVDEFISSCAPSKDEEPRGLADFLQELSLVTDNRDRETAGPAVSLLTCHSAKGLEFDHVFLVGLEEGLLPHATAFDSAVEMEEERRLCYVAMTRARKSLSLSFARTRALYGGRGNDAKPSRFLREIPREWIDAGAPSNAETPEPRVLRPAAPPVVESAELRTGTKVRHAKFGAGVVVYTSGSGKALKARIRFQTGPARDFLVDKTPLEILEGGQR